MAFSPYSTWATRSALRQLRSLSALVILTILAASCYSLDAAVVVNDDGSGSFAVEYIIDKDTSEASLIAGDLIAACDAVKVMQNAAPAGSVFTPLDSSSQCGARINMDFANEVELVEGMALLTDRSRFAGFGYFPDISVSRGADEGTWNFQAQFKPPLPANLNAQTEFRNEVGGGTFVLSVDLPGRQVEHNATRISETGTMIFEINPLTDPSGQFFVKTEPGAKIVGVDEGSSFPWNRILFAVVAIAAIFSGFFILQRSKRRRQYEGDDDDDSMISASERLGFGRSKSGSAEAPAEPELSSDFETLPSETLPSQTLPSQTLPSETLPSETLPSETLASLPFISEHVPDESSTSLFSGSEPPEVGSWPTEEPGALESPVFEAAQESPASSSWMTTSQAMQNEPVPTDAMADWPGSSLDVSVADPIAEPQMPVAPIAAAPMTGAVDRWTPDPHATLASAPQPDNAVIVDHNMNAVSSVQQVAPAPQAPSLVTPQAPSLVTPQAPSSVAAAPEPFIAAAVQPVAPAQTDPAPSQSDMVWDAQRNTYVVYDHRRTSWMAFDDTSQSWTPIS